MQDMLPETTGDANNLPMSFQTLSDTAKKLEGIIKGNNRAAFLALMKKVISSVQYLQLAADVNERGLPKRIITDPISATVVHAAFRAQGINLIAVEGTPHLPTGTKLIIDWDDSIVPKWKAGTMLELAEEIKYGPVKATYACPDCGGDVKVRIKRVPFLGLTDDYAGRLQTTIENCTSCNLPYDSIQGLIKKT